MTAPINCSHCKNDFPMSQQRCPHCGLPGLFPNVAMALSEESVLQNHYDKAKSEAVTRGVNSNVDDFEKALNNSRAVINRSTTELLRLVGNEFEVYATYYQLSSTITMQSGNIWDSRRQAADAIFFTDYHEDIRFASLSLNSIGLSNYGDCSWIFRENMIAHRASVFKENTTLFYLKNNFKEAKAVPKGYRAIWADRAKLCVVKLAAKIDTTTIPAQYSNILLSQRATLNGEDEFVEVHILGSMTIRTIEEVSFNPVSTTISKKERLMKLAMIEGIKEKLGKYGVKVI